MNKKQNPLSRAKRYPLLLPLRVWVQNFMQGLSGRRRPEVVTEETITSNISSTGCYFLLDEEPPVGTRVDMEIAIPSPVENIETGKILCRGKIVRVEKEPEKGKTGVAVTIDHYRLVPSARPARER